MNLHHGDCLDVMAGMEPESVDAVVTDPPKGWVEAAVERAFDAHDLHRYYTKGCPECEDVRSEYPI